MLRLSGLKEMQAFSAQARRDKRTIGFVPTMGALHEGHLALAAEARKRCDLLVVSIFVNPIQFGPKEDFNAYPRDLEKDAQLLAPYEVDVLFTPSAAEMFPDGFNVQVEVKGITETLCGKSRPGHFAGVATVVAKLFNLVQPDRAFFGAKDYQQQLVIRKMVADLNFPVEIVTLPTVRESDGLAMSSRNRYLSPEERQAATVLYRGLLLAKEALAKGTEPIKVQQQIEAFIGQEPLAKLDYVTVVDSETLAEASNKGKHLVALAVYIGKTRLIDNLVV
ncbi:MAG: pantoate--beta-alanine ligase [Candidatus Margulisiibacteriota bacterium]|jgi:pantoate--beta-alanine ligase